MPNKAIHQLAFSNTVQGDDRLYVVREGADYQIQASAFGPALLSQTVVISSAEVLTLNTTPIQVVDNAPDGFSVFGIRSVVQFSGGSTNYATNTELVIGNTGTVSDTDFQLVGDIADRTSAIGLASVNNSTNYSVGNGLSAYITGANPTAGNSDLVITTFYYLVELQ